MSETIYLLGLSGAVAAFLVYWVIWATAENPPLAGAVTKAAAVGIVAILVGTDSLQQALRYRHFSTFDWIALGLACGAVGDFALARKGGKAFLAGMFVFALGHIAYAWAFWRRTTAMVAMDSAHNAGALFGGGGINWPQIVALILLLGLLASTEVWLAPHTGALRWPVRAYVAVIGLMAGNCVLLVPSQGTFLLWLGGGLFLLSDLLLALRLFVVTTTAWKTRLSLAVWPAYWCGQMLILFGAMLYWAFPKG